MSFLHRLEKRCVTTAAILRSPPFCCRLLGRGGGQAGAGLACGEKINTIAGVMSAAEIIEKLSVAEREQVRVYLEKKPVVAEQVREIRYISDEKFDEISPRVFEQHHDLLRRLSQ